MNARRGKDFLLDQTAKQAALDGVTLADIEKRMMYYTECDEGCDDPASLNEEFASDYSCPEYEPRIARHIQSSQKGNPLQKELGNR
jgi:hypothetical protein